MQRQEAVYLISMTCHGTTLQPQKVIEWLGDDFEDLVNEKISIFKVRYALLLARTQGVF